MLPRIFIKDYKDITSPKVRNAYGILASVVGIICNVLLSSAKIVVGVLFGSVAILADGLNNLSDAGSSVVTMLGFRIANIPPDKNHPFGHARVEYVASLVVAILILLLGVEIIDTSIGKLVNGLDTTANVVMIVVLAVSIVVKIGMFAYYRYYAKKIDSTALKAASIDSFNDSIASLAVLICTIVLYTTGFDMDGYFGIGVAIIIIVSGIGIFKETLSPLLGESPSPRFIKEISDKLHSYEGVIGIHDLEVHSYGPKNYHITAHVEVDAERDIMESHDLVDGIERDFKKNDIDLVIHLDPVIVNDERVEKLRSIVRAKLDEIDPSITFHDFRVVWKDDVKKLIFDIALPHGMKMSDREVVDILTSKMHEADKTCLLVVDVDRTYAGDIE